MPHRTYRTEARLDVDSGKYRALLFYPESASSPIVESRAIHDTESEAIRYVEEIVRRVFSVPPPEPAAS